MTTPCTRRRICTIWAGFPPTHCAGVDHGGDRSIQLVDSILQDGGLSHGQGGAGEGDHRSPPVLAAPRTPSRSRCSFATLISSTFLAPSMSCASYRSPRASGWRRTSRTPFRRYNSRWNSMPALLQSAAAKREGSQARAGDAGHSSKRLRRRRIRSRYCSGAPRGASSEPLLHVPPVGQNRHRSRHRCRFSLLTKSS